MRALNSYSTIAVLACSILINGCSEDDEVVGAICGGVHTVEDDFDASIVAGDIAGAIEDAVARLIDGSYTNEQLSGTTGTISITGVIARNLNASCGTDCVTSSFNHSVVAVLSTYSIIQNGAMITGTVNYGDTTGSQQNGLNFSSFGSITVSDNGTAIEYDASFADPLCAEPLVGLRDTLTSINSSGSSSSSSSQSGSLDTAAGNFFF